MRLAASRRYGRAYGKVAAVPSRPRRSSSWDEVIPVGYADSTSALLDELIELAVRRTEVDVALALVFRRLVHLDTGRS